MLTLSLICLNLIVKDKCSRLDKAYLKLTELHRGAFFSCDELRDVCFQQGKS